MFLQRMSSCNFGIPEVIPMGVIRTLAVAAACFLLLFPPPARAQTHQTTGACVSLQGNGERYPALLAQMMALMEIGIEPQVVMGGSSAAPTAALVRGLLANPSLRETRVLHPDGTEMLPAQKAARLLAASISPIETLLVMPAFNRLGETLRNLLLYRGAELAADAFLGFPSQALANIETAAGQTAMLSEFFTKEDFSDLVAEPDFSRRQQEVFERWLRFGNHMLVTPREFIRALVTAPKDPAWTPRKEEIKTRFFEFFRTTITPPGEMPEKALAAYNQRLNHVWKWIAQVPDAQLEATYRRALDVLRRFPFVSYAATTVASPFWLPDSRRIWERYVAQDSPLPAGTIIHSSARIARRTAAGSYQEKEGLENLFQVLLPSADVAPDLVAAHERLFPARSFLEYPEPAVEWARVLPAEQFVVLPARPLSTALVISEAEPNAFRRDPIVLRPEEMVHNTLLHGNALLTYGGWLDHVNLGTLARVPACTKASFHVEVSTLSEGLRSFQVRAARPIISGAIPSILRRLLGLNESSGDPTVLWVDALWRSWRHSRTLHQGYIHLNFDWDNASGQQGDLAVRLNQAFDTNRKAIFLRAYQHAASDLARDFAGLVPTASIFGRDLRKVDLGRMGSVEAIQKATADLMQ